MTLVIVGVGALGSHLVQFVRNEKTAIRIIDFDRVELKNVSSQFHSKTSVGKNKTAALAQTVDFLYGRKLQGVPNKLSTDNVNELLGPRGTDKPVLVVDCVDNAATRTLIQNHCRIHSIPCLHGALAADGQFGRVIWSEQFVIDSDASGAATCEDGEHLPFIALTAAYLARAVQIFLRSGKRVGFSVTPGGAMCV